MEVGVIVICITVGALICFALFEIGVICGRYDKRQSDGDSCVHSSVTVGSGNRSGHNICNLSNEELAYILRTMAVTGVAPSPFERECLEELVERIEKLDRVERWVEDWGKGR